MPEPTEFSDEAIAKWAEEQIRLADAVPGGKLIIEAAQAMRLKLRDRDQAYELRRSQLVAERIQAEGRSVPKNGWISGRKRPLSKRIGRRVPR